MFFLIIFMSIAIYTGILSFMFRRNQKVSNFRMMLIDKMVSYQPGDYWWRVKVFDRVSYNEMVYKFWRPLWSFYPDKSFIEPPKV